MAYDPLNFFNNGTLVGVAGNVNAPGGQGVWVIANGVASYYPPNSTAYIPGIGITITGTAPVLTIANAGVLELAQGTIAAAGTIDIGANLTLNSGGTLSGSAGGGGGQTFASGQGISFSGTSPDFTINNEGVLELIQGATTASGNITVGSNLTLSGSTLSGSAGGSGGITEFIQGTLTATGAATLGSGLTLSGTTNPTLTAGTASGTIGVEYAGTLYPTLAAGTDVTLSGSGSTLTVSASGGGGGGALILIASQTISTAVSEVDLLGVFTSSYDDYLVELIGFYPGTTNISLGLQFGNQSGPVWVTAANYAWGQINAINGGGSVQAPGSNTDTSWGLFVAWNQGANANRAAHASLRIRQPLSTAYYQFGIGEVIYTNATNVAGGITQLSLIQTPASYDSFRLIVSSGTITAGTVRVYGYQT